MTPRQTQLMLAAVAAVVVSLAQEYVELENMLAETEENITLH